MPDKNWKKTKPTVEDTWCWYTRSLDGCKQIYYIYQSPLSGKMKAQNIDGDVINIDVLKGWWAPATPPPFDGEDE